MASGLGNSSIHLYRDLPLYNKVLSKFFFQTICRKILCRLFRRLHIFWQGNALVRESWIKSYSKYWNLDKQVELYVKVRKHHLLAYILQLYLNNSMVSVFLWFFPKIFSTVICGTLVNGCLWLYLGLYSCPLIELSNIGRWWVVTRSA